MYFYKQNFHVVLPCTPIFLAILLCLLSHKMSLLCWAQQFSLMPVTLDLGQWGKAFLLFIISLRTQLMHSLV